MREFRRQARGIDSFDHMTRDLIVLSCNTFEAGQRPSRWGCLDHKGGNEQFTESCAAQAQAVFEFAPQAALGIDWSAFSLACSALEGLSIPVMFLDNMQIFG